MYRFNKKWVKKYDSIVKNRLVSPIHIANLFCDFIGIDKVEIKREVIDGKVLYSCKNSEAQGFAKESGNYSYDKYFATTNWLFNIHKNYHYPLEFCY